MNKVPTYLLFQKAKPDNGTRVPLGYDSPSKSLSIISYPARRSDKENS